MISQSATEVLGSANGTDVTASKTITTVVEDRSVAVHAPHYRQCSAAFTGSDSCDGRSEGLKVFIRQSEINSQPIPINKTIDH
jgi:hypothetical protein